MFGVWTLLCGPVDAGDDPFGNLKSEMQSVSEENEELAKQNKTLRVQLIGLQMEVESREDELRELDPGYRSPLTGKRERTEQPMTPQVTRELEQMEDAELMKEAQEIFLSGEHVDMDEEQRMKELELYDLAIRKQELELDLKEKSGLIKDIDGQRKLEFEAVDRQAQVTFQKEARIREKMAEAEKLLISYPQDIELLRMENQQLKKQIEALRDKLVK